jgi:hypothetical protein
MSLTTTQLTRLKASGLTGHIISDVGIAGELQRLFVLHPQCPKRANALIRFAYEQRDTILSALRLAEV